MNKFLLKIYSHFLQSLTFKPSLKIKIKKDIIYFGLGGSAISGDLLKIVFPSLNIEVKRTFKILPSEVKNFKNKSIIVASWSGMTKETILVLKQLLKLKQKPIILTSNGEIEKIALNKNLPLIKFPLNNFPPRFNFGYFFSSLIWGLNKQKYLQLNKISKRNPKKFYNQILPQAKKIIPILKNKIIAIYTDEFNFPLTILAKIKINENLHRHCLINYFPELFHNEILGYNSKKLPVLIFKNKNNLLIEKEREIFKKLLKNKSKIQEIILPQNSFLKIIFVNLLIETATFLIKKEKILDTSLLNKIKNLLNYETNNNS